MSSWPRVVAAADLGSNTVKISIASVSADGAIVEISNGAETIRLGAGIERTGAIDPDRIRQCVDVLSDYEQRARALGARTFIGIATEALRVAHNADVLLDRIAEVTAWRIRVISGDEEARLTFVGLRERVPDSGSSLVADIGGGSTELIRAQDGQMRDHLSLPVGSGRLADRYFSSDPPPQAVLDMVTRAAVDALGTCALLDDAECVVLCGGNGVFLAQLTEQVLGEPVTTESLQRLLVHFAAEPAARTAARLGIAHERARVLPAGAAIALAILRLSAPGEVRCVPSGLRIGLIREWALGSA